MLIGYTLARYISARFLRTIMMVFATVFGLVFTLDFVELLRRAGDVAIAGVACSGHGKGLYLWGKDDKPCFPGIVSTDSRASIYPQRWAADGTAERVFAKTCQSILACQPVALLRWLKDHRPEVIADIKWIFAVKDYIRFKLTGEAFAELTDYSGSNLLNLRDGCFDRELLADYEADLDLIAARGAGPAARELAGWPGEVRGFGPVRGAALAPAAARRQKARLAVMA